MILFHLSRLDKRLLRPLWPHLILYQCLIWFLFAGIRMGLVELDFRYWLTISLANSFSCLILFALLTSPLQKRRLFIRGHVFIYWFISSSTIISLYSLTRTGEHLVLLPYIALLILSSYYAPEHTKIRFIIWLFSLAIIGRYSVNPDILLDKQRMYSEVQYIIAIMFVSFYGHWMAIKREKNFHLIQSLLAENHRHNANLHVAHSELSTAHRHTIQRNKDLERNLQKARNVQQKLLPEILPANIDSKIGLLYRPADMVGGDFYDVRKSDNGHLSLIIVDVFGHGFPAALVASMAKIVLDNINWANINPKEALSQLNKQIYGHTAGHLISACMLSIDDENRIFRCANAGHPFPYLISEEYGIHQLKIKGALLGLWKDPVYDEKTIHYRSKDLILMYTDGVTDICNHHNVSLGEKGFLEIALRCLRRDPKSWLRAVERELERYSGTVSMEDDITIIGYQL